MSCMSTQAEGIGVVKRQRNWGFGMLGFGFSVMMLFCDGSYIALLYFSLKFLFEFKKKFNIKYTSS